MRRRSAEMHFRFRCYRTPKTGIGRYALAATTPATLTAEVAALTFTPTRGEVAPVQSVRTGFTLFATQGGVTVTDSTTTVVGTAIAQASTITGATAAQPGTDAAAIAPFARLTIADPNGGSPAETVTVTPSSTANGQSR